MQEENRVEENAELKIGGNDKYLIKKLKQYSITSQKIDAYLQKIRTEEQQVQQELQQF